MAHASAPPNGEPSQNLRPERTLRPGKDQGIEQDSELKDPRDRSPNLDGDERCDSHAHHEQFFGVRPASPPGFFLQLFAEEHPWHRTAFADSLWKVLAHESAKGLTQQNQSSLHGTPNVG